MLFNKYLGSQVIDLETGMISDNSLLECYGGGGKGSYEAPAPQPIIQPTPAVEEATVQVDDQDDMPKKRNKESLKIPLETSSNTGLNIGTTDSGGLGI